MAVLAPFASPQGLVMVLICVSLRVRGWNLNCDFISWLGRRTIIDWSLFRLFLLIEKKW